MGIYNSVEQDNAHDDLDNVHDDVDNIHHNPNITIDNVNNDLQQNDSDDNKYNNDQHSSVDSIWLFDISDIQKENMKRMELILSNYCKAAIANQQSKNTSSIDAALTSICALSQKYKIPLTEWILSVFYREFIDNFIASGKDLTVAEFVNKYKLFTHYNSAASQSLYNQFSMIIDICHRRLFAKPRLSIIPYRICDDINDYIEIVTSFDKEIKSLSSYPLQIDLWIIPKGAESTNNMNDHKQIDIGDIDAELKSCSKLQAKSRYHYEIKNLLDISWPKVFHVVLQESRKKFGKDTLEQYRRYIMIIDRRKMDVNNSININFFKAPKGKKLPKEHYQYLSLINFCYSKKLPKIDNNDIGAYHRMFNMFCLSYHLKQEDNISVYWCFNGSQLRFYQADMIKIWPLFFVSNNITTANQITACQVFRDNQFEQFYEMTMEKPLSVLPPKDLDTLCELIKQEMEHLWPQLTSQIITFINTDFEDIDNLFDDIQDDDDDISTILSQVNVPEFNQELKTVIQSFNKN